MYVVAGQFDDLNEALSIPFKGKLCRQLLCGRCYFNPLRIVLDEPYDRSGKPPEFAIGTAMISFSGVAWSAAKPVRVQTGAIPIHMASSSAKPKPSDKDGKRKIALLEYSSICCCTEMRFKTRMLG